MDERSTDDIAADIFLNMPSGVYPFMRAMGDGPRTPPGDDAPTVQIVAHHCERLGIIRRCAGPSPSDQGTIELTPLGERVLAIIEAART